MQEAGLAAAAMSPGNSHNCWLPCRGRQWVQLHWLLQMQWSTVITTAQTEEALPPKKTLWRHKHEQCTDKRKCVNFAVLTNAYHHTEQRATVTKKRLFFSLRKTVKVVATPKTELDKWHHMAGIVTQLHIDREVWKNEEWESPNNLICPWVPSYCLIVLSEPDKLGGVAVSEQREREKKTKNQW